MTQMASVTLQVGANVQAFNNFAGNQDKIFYYDDVTRLYEIPIPPGNQGQLNGKANAYAAGQAAIDAAFAVDEDVRGKTRKKDLYDNDPVLQAVVAWATDEINTLRALHALPALTPAAVDAAVKNKIDNP